MVQSVLWTKKDYDKVVKEIMQDISDKCDDGLEYDYDYWINHAITIALTKQQCCMCGKYSDCNQVNIGAGVHFRCCSKECLKNLFDWQDKLKEEGLSKQVYEKWHIAEHDRVFNSGYQRGLRDGKVNGQQIEREEKKLGCHFCGKGLDYTSYCLNCLRNTANDCQKKAKQARTKLIEEIEKHKSEEVYGIGTIPLDSKDILIRKTDWQKIKDNVK